MSLSARTSAADVLGPLLHEALDGPLPLALRLWDDSIIEGTSAEPTLVLKHRRAIRRLLWSPDEIGLARAYVSGDLDVDGDLFAALGKVMELIRPDDVVGRRPGPKALGALARAAIRLRVLGPPPRPPAEEVRLGGHRHTRRRDAAAIAHHYDIGNDFYRLVLGESMTYSCAYWDPQVCDPADAGGLSAAQFAKCDLVARKLGLRPGTRVLDVGCGWGTFALHAARTYGAHVVGVTLSERQAEYARQRIADAGVDHLVEIRVQDYRTLTDGPFEAISSIGMAEHVGTANLGDYAASLFELLRPQGRLLNHAIALRPDDPQQAPEPSSFIDRYVFPDGELAPVATMVAALEGAGLEVRDVEALREHYALTLRAWVGNLDAHWREAVEATSAGRARVWKLYMTASALSFEANEIGVNQVLAVRPDGRGTSAMPRTRSALLGS